MYRDTMFMRQGLCPEDCHACVDVCPQKTPGGLAGIKKVKKADRWGIALCNQCGEPACVPSCPTGALSRNDNGIVTVGQELCTGCGSCESSCPYDGIYVDDIAVKCDYCGGEPKCVAACPHGVLRFAQSKKIIDHYVMDDPVSPGLALCSGCTAELAIRVVSRVLGPNTIYFGAPSCCNMGGSTKMPTFGCLMTNVSSTMTGVKRYWNRTHQEANVVGFIGDGTSTDVGFQPLSGATERGENIIHICYDNEGYMNTGIQRSSTTPPHAWTQTTQIGPMSRGKSRPQKYVPLLLALQGAAYVATATLSHLDDFAMKLEKAKSIKNGLSYIHLFCPCPTGWRAAEDKGVEICRLAVDTNFFPLWEMENSRLTFNVEVHHPRPLTDYLKLMRRFAHYNQEDLDNLQKEVDARLLLLKRFVDEPRPVCP
ncbi:MAG: 4Fe-4S binding protein [Deltaproteobacteria bacterium]|nr:4Fe-4S binding protein [Deltaproteobacteria bacterium]